MVALTLMARARAQADREHGARLRWGPGLAATPALADYFRLLRRPTVVRILAADLLTGLAPGVAGTLFFFYFMRVKQFSFLESSALLLIYSWRPSSAR
jgi:hypothetical protein